MEEGTRRWAIALAIALLVLAPSTVRAQDEQQPEVGEAEDDSEGPPEQQAEPPAEEPPPPNVVEANERVERGEQLFEQGNYDAALAEFERAYELVEDHPSRFFILYNIGQAHERRFRYDLAMRYYQRYLDEGGPDAPDRAMVEGTIRTLEGLLATVEVAVNVPEAEVWVNERQIGTAPGEILVPAGRHVVEVRAPGYVPAQREVQLAPRTTETVSFELEELAEEYRGLGPAYFWTASVLAMVSLGVGGAFGIIALGENSELHDRAEDPSTRWTVTEEDNDRVARLALIADIGFGAAALFGGGALILAFMTDWGPSEDEAPDTGLRLTPAVSQAAAGLSLGGAF